MLCCAHQLPGGQDVAFLRLGTAEWWGLAHVRVVPGGPSFGGAG